MVNHSSATTATRATLNETHRTPATTAAAETEDKREAAHARIVPGCDCLDCANTNPDGALTFRAVDVSANYLYPAGTKYAVTRSDGADFGVMFKNELLQMRAAYGCEIEFRAGGKG